MTGTVLKQIDLAAKIGQDGSAMQAMHALGVIRDLIAGYTAKLTTVEGEREAKPGLFCRDCGGRLAVRDVCSIYCPACEACAAPAQAEAERLREAYEWGYNDGQNNPNGYSDKKERDACVSKLLKQPSPAQAEKAEAERPEVVAWRYGSSGGIVSDKACLDEWKSGGEYQSLMTVAQHECIVGELRAVIAQLRQHKNDYMDSGQETYRALQNEIREREAEIARLDGLVSGRTAERDAALARVADMKTMADNYCALLMDANAKLAEMERQEPVALANRGLHAFWVKWTEAAAGLYGPGIKLYAHPVAQAQHSVPEGFREKFTKCMELVFAEIAYYVSPEKARDPNSRARKASVLATELRDMLAAAPGREVPQAWLDVQAERRRQVEAEGWTPEHDDLYCAAELPRAAAAYILNGANDEAPAIWPFSAKWWKPRDARSNYVRAGALILAEIERLDRAAEKEQE
ncbi:TPA: hypothetical protein ACLMYU_005225 [Pseudomonas aeruginosa]